MSSSRMVDQPVDFFISYTGRDEAWATWVARRLELAGYRVLLQAWDFGAGSFIGQMAKAVRRSRRLIAILSEPYLVSKWGRLELEVFMQMSLASVVPVQIEDINSSDLLGPLVRINLVGLAEQAAEEKLLREIKRLTEPPGHESRDRSDGSGTRFPDTSYRVSADIAGEPDSAEALVPSVTADRDRIQLILLGDGEAAREAAASFYRLLDIPSERCCDLFASELSADQQLTRLTQLVQKLDPEVVSDVVVVYAGTGSNDRDAGVRLQVRATHPAAPATSTIGLVNLLECLTDDRRQLRSCVILDVVDAEGRPVGPTTPGPVPVLMLGRRAGGCGLAEVQEALAMPPEMLIRKLPHWGPLSLRDLQELVGGELVADEHSRVDQIGLIPSPLTWPRRDRTDDTLANWCAVVSESDARRPGGELVGLVVDKLASQSRRLLNEQYRRWGHTVQLTPRPGKVLAGNVLSSPRSFGHAVEQVCHAELAVFDLTNFEPAVMILLGIRAVIRRGLTVCVVGEHDQPWQYAEPPFHLREVSLVKAPDRDAVEARIVEGIKQLVAGEGSYADLPCFDLVRGVSPDPDQRQTRAFDAGRNPSILALVPFDPAYVDRNWAELKDSLPAAARDEIIKLRGGTAKVRRPALERTLDLNSPRVVSAQLFEAIRLTDFCLVDLTSARPNVFFELGVRLAANRLHPVVIVDLEYPSVPGPEADWLTGVDNQLRMIRRLLQPVRYTPTLLDAFPLMVERHLEFRRLLGTPEDSRAQSPLGGLPPAGVYDIAWRHAVDRDEVVTTPVQERLQSLGEGLLVDDTAGQLHLIYPVGHRLTESAERTGREYLIAAWLYLHFRARVANDSDAGLIRRHEALTDKLLLLLDQTGDQADASFAARVEQWLADEETGGKHD